MLMCCMYSCEFVACFDQLATNEGYQLRLIALLQFVQGLCSKAERIRDKKQNCK